MRTANGHRVTVNPYRVHADEGETALYTVEIILTVDGECPTADEAQAIIATALAAANVPALSVAVTEVTGELDR